MARHDDLVAELLATGGPFMFKDWKQVRAGNAVEVIRSRYKKSTIGVWLFAGIMLIYLTSTVVLYDQGADRDLATVLFRSANSLMYLAFTGFIFQQKRNLEKILKRIESGEFSRD